MPILSVKGLNWSVAGKALLCDINFQVPRGAMLGLIGPNGAGKSSLLRCLYRYIKPDNGHIMLDNVDIQSISSKALASKIAVVQQDTPAELDICVWDIVSMGLLPTKSWLEFDSTGDAQLIQNALAKVSLIEYAECPFNQLSGGERQRALIARAIVQQPQLLILDEPTNHLDIRYQIQLLELVKSLKISVIASIHDLNLASSLCDKLLLLDQGHLIAQGSPQVILTEETIASVFGVCTKVQPHPQHGKPLITYFY